MTSSVAAVVGNHGERGRRHIYTEDDWNLSCTDTYLPYHQAKKLSEEVALEMEKAQERLVDNVPKLPWHWIICWCHWDLFLTSTHISVVHDHERSAQCHNFCFVLCSLDGNSLSSLLALCAGLHLATWSASQLDSWGKSCRAPTSASFPTWHTAWLMWTMLQLLILSPWSRATPRAGEYYPTLLCSLRSDDSFFCLTNIWQYCWWHVYLITRQ